MKEDQIDERAEKSTAESPCHRPRLSRVNIAANHRTSNTPLYIHLFVHTNPSHPQKIPTFRIVCTSNLLSQPPERKLETIPLILGEAHQLFLLLPIPPARARILGKVDRVLRPIRLRPGKTGPVVINYPYILHMAGQMPQHILGSGISLLQVKKDVFFTWRTDQAGEQTRMNRRSWYSGAETE